MRAITPVFFFLALTLASASLAPLEAQRAPGGRSGDDRSRLEERIRARMGDIIRHRLGLDRAEEARLSEVVQGFEARRRALAASERETRQQIEPLLESGSATDAQAAALIDRMVQLKRQEAELFQEEQAQLQEVLTPTQVLQFYQLRVELGRRIRALRSGDRDSADIRRRTRPPGSGAVGSPLER
jgi:Spy/CpxP family protein refolding chaperone